MNKCTECRFCNVEKYHRGKWYCSSPNVSIFHLPIDTDKCFEKRENIMREILFRGKSREHGEWVYGGFCAAVGNYPSMIYSKEDTGLFDINQGIPVIPETVCQYTGLTDKNGRKIFEGDIVEIPTEDERYVIEWDTDSARFAIVQHGSIMCDFDNYWGYELEVIGNIFDNLELIGG